jgi:activating signal cointegrator 1
MSARAITLHQPYASLVAMGIKSRETRSWGTNYHGPLLIHAAKRWDAAIEKDVLRAVRLTIDCHFAAGSSQEAISKVPWKGTLGCVLARARLVMVERVPAWGWTPNVDAPEWDFLFGDLSPGRYAWSLADVQPVLPPVPWRGAQGLWNVPAELMERLSVEQSS